MAASWGWNPRVILKPPKGGKYVRSPAIKTLVSNKDVDKNCYLSMSDRDYPLSVSTGMNERIFVFVLR